LLDLGYRDSYHYASLFNENSRDAEMWVEAMEAKFEGKGNLSTRVDWDQSLGHCMVRLLARNHGLNESCPIAHTNPGQEQAITDMPCTVFCRKLVEAYPEAKVVLTVRDKC
jgi:hypothetical protein